MPSEPRPLQVFLCHASQDKPVARKLYQQLQKDGVRVWLDSESLLPGMHWQIEIPTAIQNSDIVLVCLSRESVDKEGYIKNEIEFALNIADKQPEGTVFIIPIRLEECPVPDRLAGYQWVNVFEPGGYERLLEALRIRAKEIGALPPRKKGLSTFIPGLSKQITFHKAEYPVRTDTNRSPAGVKELFEQNRRWIIISAEVIGIASSLLALMAFFTGKETIGQYFQGAPTSTAAPLAVAVKATAAEATHTSTLPLSQPPTPSRTATPHSIPPTKMETVTSTPKPGYTIVDPGEVLNIAPSLRTLGQLALEKYSIEERNKMNNTLTFTVESTPNVPILWRWFWCAATTKILEQNMTKISILFDADGYLIPEERLAKITFTNADPTYKDWQCLTYETVLRDWKPGTYTLTQTMTIAAPINDGRQKFEAGYKIYEYTVKIKP